MLIAREKDTKNEIFPNIHDDLNINDKKYKDTDHGDYDDLNKLDPDEEKNLPEIITNCNKKISGDEEKQIKEKGEWSYIFSDNYEI